MNAFRRNHLAALCVAGLVVFALHTHAQAEAATPLFPQARLCPDIEKEALSQDRVTPKDLVASLLDQHVVRDGILDANGDGNTAFAEKVRALTEDDYCTSIATTCSDDDKATLKEAQDQLKAFAASKGKPGYAIERLDGDGNVLTHDAGAITPADLLDPTNQTLAILCVAVDADEQAAADAETPFWHGNGEKKGGFRLAGDIDNLSKSRGSIGAVKAAQLSITSDLIEDETAYRVNAVLGYDFEVVGGDDVTMSFIPFIEAERVTSGSETQIDTLGAGFQQAATVQWPGSLISQFAVTPVYRTDSDFDSHTGTLKFRWTPSLAPTAGFPLGFSSEFGPIELRFGLDFLADAGRVFDEGDSNNLEGEGTFLRLGNQASMQIRGAPDTLIRPFELQLHNRYLHNVDTDFSDINQFDAALAYIFPGSENYQLSFAYSNGRDENSLELYEFWQTQFGIRF